jgi:hypothetical protein
MIENDKNYQSRKNIMIIKENTKNIFFYWDGIISDSRMKILEDCLYSTRIFNPERPIYLISNSISQLDTKYQIEIINWDDDLFDGINIPILDKYKSANHREMSDLIRLVLLYKFGGSYIDTDDLCINKLPTLKNLVCRSYDPHTCHYNQLTPEDCIPGKYREVSGYEHINIFPRNDCWLNFEPKSKFIEDIFNNPKFKNSDKVIYIGDGFSWQSLTLESCLKNIDSIGSVYNLGLTLVYLYEDFVSASSYWDRCLYGGEMCDIYKSLPEIEDYDWGSYKCNKETAENFYQKILDTYPYVSHMWLHSKDMKEEWMRDDIDDLSSLSNWIYKIIKNKF